MQHAGYHILHAMLPWLERYEAAGGSGHLAEFAQWLQAQPLAPADAPPAPEAGQGPMPDFPRIPAESRVFQHVVQLFRRLKQDTKAASEGLPMNHLDEFVMLMIVTDMPGVRKNDLVTMNRMETSSGNDMVNRLIRHGWLREEPDRRFRRLYITDSGRALAFELARRYNAVSAQILQPLEPQQIRHLLQLLQIVDPDDAAY